MDESTPTWRSCAADRAGWRPATPAILALGVSDSPKFFRGEAGRSPQKARQGSTARAAGIRIAVPAGWQAVPPTVRAVKQRIAQLRAQKRNKLAATYRYVLANPSAKSAAFVAFAWPQPPGARSATLVTIRVIPVPSGIAAAVSNSLIAVVIAAGAMRKVE
jgi:hypothetical protein